GDAVLRDGRGGRLSRAAARRNGNPRRHQRGRRRESVARGAAAAAAGLPGIHAERRTPAFEAAALLCRDQREVLRPADAGEETAASALTNLVLRDGREIETIDVHEHVDELLHHLLVLG